MLSRIRPVSIPVWDRLLITFALMLGGFGLLLLTVDDDPIPALLATCGSVAIVASLRREQRRHEAAVWALAASAADPVAALAVHERLYRMPVRDMLAVARWRRGGHTLTCEHEKPPAVAALIEHVGS